MVSSIVEILGTVIDRERIADDLATRDHFSRDLFQSGSPPQCVVKPVSVDEVSAVLRVAHEHGLPVVPRGGGMSYTGGYVADNPNAIMMDLRDLNRVIKIDPVNRYVTVQAGCTWAQLREALADTGLRTPYWGPLSGLRATVGGTVSQNSVFFGSVRHGSAAESVLGLTMVLADGSLLKTGAGARACGVPFTRWGGPDLTGVFIGDTGSMGFKVEITLRLIPESEYVEYGSYAFPDFASMLNAQVGLVQAGLGVETFGIDAYKAKNSAQTGRKLSEATKTALGVVKSGKSLLAGLKNVAEMAMAGTSEVEVAPYSLHLTVEGRSQQDVVDQLAQVKAIVEGCRGTVIAPVIPKAMRGRPFPPLRSALGVDGQRWVPVHGIIPLGNVVQAVEEAEQLIASYSDDFERLGVLYSPLTTNVPNGVLFEPCFYWYDKVTSLHAEAIDETVAPAWLERPDRAEVREFVFKLWREVADVLAKHGAINFQIGRAYPYLEEVSAAYQNVLQSIKNAVDVKGIVNPGVLGLGRGAVARQ